MAIPRAMQARFTFVAFDADGNLKSMPALTPESEEEKNHFDEGKRRYERRKTLRTQ